MIKKIRIWKIVVLLVATLGIYGLVWLALRRSEIIKHTKLSVPHWAWLVVPTASAFLLLLPVAFLSYGLTSKLSSMFAITLSFVLTLLAIAFLLSIWWIWVYGKAVAKITNGKIPNGWTLAYWIFTGPATIVMHQYYFNRLSKSAPKKPSKPSTKFVIVSLIAIVVSIVLSTLSIATEISSVDWQKDFAEASGLDAQGAKADKLLREYNTCIDQLEKKYPGELLAENEESYLAEYDRCEKIRVEQNKAANEFNKALELW